MEGEVTCPACGFSESRLRLSLELGCPACYRAFAPHLSTFLPRLHTGTRHTGKIPQARALEFIVRSVDRLAAQVTAHDPASAESRILQTLQSQLPRPRD
jgi:protein-arginine kinase activator protein McsA